MKIKFLMLLTILLVSTLAVNAALVVPNDKIKINGDSYESGETIEVEKGDSLTIKIKLNNNGPDTEDGSNDIKNIIVSADILGYEYDTGDLYDQTDPFDLDEMDTVYKTLKLKVPENAEKDYYAVRVRAGGRTGTLINYDLNLHIKGSRHQLAIKDVILSPENEVKAGRYLIASVRVKNYGEKDEEGIKIKVSIPGLGVSESDYIDELEDDESTTSEELLLRIPVNAEGEYTVKTTVEYDEGTEVETREDTINVVSAEYVTGEEKTVINVGLESQSLKAGESTVYPIMITNTASTAKTYTISVSGVAGWGSVVVQPSNVVTVAGGETSTVSVSLSVNSDASSGEKAFVVEVSSPTKSASIPLKAVVDGKVTSTWGRLKTVLEVALIVLVVLLVIIGLIIGFNRLKGNEEEEEKTYY